VTALAAETATAIGRPQRLGTTGRLFEPSEVTLEDSILGAWEALEARGRTGCPVCRGEMLTADGCASCGSHLS
jgi:hypothetical protein